MLFMVTLIGTLQTTIHNRFYYTKNFIFTKIGEFQFCTQDYSTVTDFAKFLG